MSKRYPLHYVPAPWLQYRKTGTNVWQWCQPDGLLFDIRGGRLIVVEIKLKHTSDSWWQIRRLYEPLLQRLFGRHWRFSALEVCRWYDPAIPFPEPLYVISSPLAIDNGRFGAFIYRP